MMDVIRSIDYSLFSFINGNHNAALDFLMWWTSNKWIWIPFYCYLAWFLYRKYPKQALSILIFAGIMIVVSDQVSSSVIKNAIHRLRPCHNPELASQVHLVNGYCGGQFGFLSSHAANSFALATFLIFLFSGNEKTLRWILIVWACLICYSRVYLGAHFPADVFCGALFGVLIGFIMYRLYKMFSFRFLSIPA